VKGALLATIASLALGAPAEAATHACRPHGSKTVRASSAARVYELRGTVYGCLFAAGRRYRLGENDDELGDYVGPIRLRGRLVGFARQSFDHYGNANATVVVRDLRTGKVAHSFSDSGGGRAMCDEPEPPSYSVTDLALAPAGAVAWIGEAHHCGFVAREVTTLATGKPREVVDQGLDIDPASLRYAGGSIFWLDFRGDERSAPLS
jgi:hypothetical protein